jgi:anti-anti-sigma factor
VDLTVTLDTTPLGVPVVSVHGEVDMLSAPALDARLREVESLEPAVFVVDLGGLTFLDSAGLRSLLLAVGRAAAQRRRVLFVQPQRAVRRVFELSGVLSRLDVLDDVDAAEAALTSAG